MYFDAQKSELFDTVFSCVYRPKHKTTGAGTTKEKSSLLLRSVSFHTCNALGSRLLLDAVKTLQSRRGSEFRHRAVVQYTDTHVEKFIEQLGSGSRCRASLRDCACERTCTIVIYSSPRTSRHFTQDCTVQTFTTIHIVILSRLQVMPSQQPVQSRIELRFADSVL